MSIRWTGSCRLGSGNPHKNAVGTKSYRNDAYKFPVVMVAARAHRVLHPKSANIP